MKLKNLYIPNSTRSIFNIHLSRVEIFILYPPLHLKQNKISKRKKKKNHPGSNQNTIFLFRLFCEPIKLFFYFCSFHPWEFSVLPIRELHCQTRMIYLVDISIFTVGVYLLFLIHKFFFLQTPKFFEFKKNQKEWKTFWFFHIIGFLNIFLEYFCVIGAVQLSFK